MVRSAVAATQGGRLGQVRSSQIITTFGPGSIVDLRDRDSYMVAGLESWPIGDVIDEPNLTNMLRITALRSPALTKVRKDVPVRRFPAFHRCPNCSRMIRGSFCQRRSCNLAAAPARFIVACPNGHVDDFPWHWWAHSKETAEPDAAVSATAAAAPACAEDDGSIVLDDRGASNSLSELYVRCLKCKSSRSLRGALNPRTFKSYPCTRLRPWLGDEEAKCAGAVRGVLRGASNVYFSVTSSALSLPRHSGPVSVLLKDHWVTLLQARETTRRALLADLLEPKGYTVEDGLAALAAYLKVAETEADLREEEYQALAHPAEAHDLGPPAPYFQARLGKVPQRFDPIIRSVTLVDRLREVRALRGLTRLVGRDQDAREETSIAIAPISRVKPQWLPAVENFGEGIFLDFRHDDVLRLNEAPVMSTRAKAISRAYGTWREQRELPAAKHPPTAAFIALHSFAHLLIRQLSLYCGYGMASIQERVYGAGSQAGILIYTSASSTDGSLGGLVSFGASDRLAAILDAGLANSEWCSQDPLCRDRPPDPGEHLSGAACHACLLLPETSCEHGNRFLDRMTLRSDSGTALLDRL